MPQVSIVTPFYNSARWLRQCIDSVLRQTFEDFEYVLVDNCSTDGGGDIAAECARRDPRIRVVNTERLLPQVDNYNFALQQISPTSQYCKLVQADDWVYPECIDACVTASLANDADLVCSFVHWNASIIPSGIAIDRAVMSGRDACRAYFLEGVYLFGSPTAQFWRSSVVRGKKNFFDPVLAPFEDASVCFELLDGRKFVFLHQVLCFSRREAGSILDRLVGSGWPQAYRLQTLRLYGRKYLSDAEYERVHSEWQREYRLVLAAARLRKRNPEFADLHSRMMKAGHMEEVGQNLFWPTMRVIWDRVGNPCRLLESLRTRLGGGSAGG